MSNDTNLGPGYRLLSLYETICDGDEFYDVTIDKWKPTNRVGEKVLPHVGAYRRRIAESQPEYRMLGAGEIICAGDEFILRPGVWVKSAQIGEKVENRDAGAYRRRINAPISCGLSPGAVIPVSRPPGLQSRNLWLEQRHGEVVNAIRRYANAGIPVPPEWIAEYFSYLETRTKLE